MPTKFLDKTILKVWGHNLTVKFALIVFAVVFIAGGFGIGYPGIYQSVAEKTGLPDNLNDLGGTTTEDSPVSAESCSNNTSTVSVSAYDLDQKGTAVASTTSKVFLSDVLQSSAPSTAGVGLSIKWYQYKTNYGGAVLEGTVGCDGFIKQQYLPALQDTACTVVNSNGITANASGAQEAIGSSGASTLILKIGAGAHYSYFGNPNTNSKNVVCFDANSTEFDKTEMAFNGTTAEVGVPSQHTSVAGYYTKCFEMPILHNTTKEDFSLYLKAKSGQDPANDIYWTLYDVDYYLNTLTNAIEIGIENNAGTDTGRAGTTMSCGTAGGSNNVIYIS